MTRGNVIRLLALRVKDLESWQAHVQASPRWSAASRGDRRNGELSALKWCLAKLAEGPTAQEQHERFVYLVARLRKSGERKHPEATAEILDTFIERARALLPEETRRHLVEVHAKMTDGPEPDPSRVPFDERPPRHDGGKSGAW